VTPGELLIAAHKEQFEAYRKEFEQLAATFRGLDGKAQGTATIAGGALGAALAFVSRPGALEGNWTRPLAALAVVGLSAAIAFSVAALGVRKVASPPSGTDFWGLLKDLRRVSDPQDLAARLPLFYSDAAELWRQCVIRRGIVNQEKAVLVWRAQCSVIGAAGCVAVLVLRFIG
jgi:hypothetical protein